MKQDELNDWIANPTTKKVLELVLEEIDAQTAGIASGNILSDSVDQTAMNCARLTGRIEGLRFFHELEGDEDE